MYVMFVDHKNLDAVIEEHQMDAVPSRGDIVGLQEEGYEGALRIVETVVWGKSIEGIMTVAITTRRLGRNT